MIGKKLTNQGILTSNQSMTSKNKYSELSILLVSDIHLSFNGCKKVASILKENNTKVDFIINSGDMANIKVYNDEKINKEAESKVLIV